MEDDNNRDVLNKISDDEIEHYRFWRNFTNKDVSPSRFKVWFYVSVARFLGVKSQTDEVAKAFAFAYPFMEVTGDLTVAWMLLWRALVADRKLGERVKKRDIAFYDGQLKSARFFINTLLPVTRGRMDAILAMDDAVLQIDDKSFGGL